MNARTSSSSKVELGSSCSQPLAPRCVPGPLERKRAQQHQQGVLLAAAGGQCNPITNVAQGEVVLSLDDVRSKRRLWLLRPCACVLDKHGYFTVHDNPAILFVETRETFLF
jgi:hypothetical protein